MKGGTWKKNNVLCSIFHVASCCGWTRIRYYSANKGVSTMTAKLDIAARLEQNNNNSVFLSFPFSERKAINYYASFTGGEGTKHSCNSQQRM